MKTILKLAAVVAFALALFIFIPADNGAKDTVYVSAKDGGILFLNGISKTTPEFCFKPELDTDYNLALVSRNGRQNVDIKFNGTLSIGSPDGDSLGLKVRGISSEKALEMCEQN